MNTKEAIQAMLDGKRIRGKDWRSGLFISFEGNTVVDADGIYFDSLTVNLAEDWEIYEEPKPKQVVVIEKWLIYDNLSKSYSIAEESNIDGYIKDDRAYISKIKLLDTYEVEL